MSQQTSIVITHGSESEQTIKDVLKKPAGNGREEAKALARFFEAVASRGRQCSFDLQVNGGDAVAASATVTFSDTGEASDTIIVNGTTFTAVASGATGNQYNVGVKATASIATTTPIVLTKTKPGSAYNTKTFRIVVNAAAANPTNTILFAFTGTAAAIVCTVTPNDGTNNSATPVTVTTANLVQLITSGVITGKSPTITDASSLRTLQTATGGGAATLAHSGEGDGLTGTFSGGTGTAALTASSLASAIVNSATAAVNTIVTASASSGVVTVSAKVKGYVGNAISIAEGVDADSVITVNHAKLTGGVDATANVYHCGF